MTRRRWIADDWDETSASLRGEQAAHLIRVLRAQTGMECDMVAGDRVWRAVISGISGDAVRFALLVGPIYGIGVWFGASLFGRASERLFRIICYVLIAAAVVIGLPALDGVLR